MDRLSTPGDLADCEALQCAVFGARSPAVLRRPALHVVAESGGLLLGVREARGLPLLGCLVDFPSSFGGFAALVSYARLVAPEARGRGFGLALHVAEWEEARSLSAAVIRGWVDPLSSVESHLLFGRMGAVGTDYGRDIFGDVSDLGQRGLATDRVAYEWWTESPRSLAAMQSASASHPAVGLHEMAVATRTKPATGGHRVLLHHDLAGTPTHVLVEIPASLEGIQSADPGAARDWRLGTRELFEGLFKTGYLLVGLVHEAGRSFQWFERVGRGEILGRDPRSHRRTT
ncbi:MAG: hypothetical protein AB1778_06835 [Candidatus Bipolaricaulota bacterium]